MPLVLDPWAATTLGAFTATGRWDPWAATTLGLAVTLVPILAVGDGRVELLLDMPGVEPQPDLRGILLGQRCEEIWLMSGAPEVIVGSAEGVILRPRRLEAEAQPHDEGFEIDEGA